MIYLRIARKEKKIRGNLCRLPSAVSVMLKLSGPNVHIRARGPAKPPCRLFYLTLIYADMYKYQVLHIKERTEAPAGHENPQKRAGGKKHGERVPPTKAMVQPLGI